CRRVRRGPASFAGPLLLIAGDASPVRRLAYLQSGVDAYLLRPFLPGELLQQLEVLRRWHRVDGERSELADEVQSLCRRLHDAYRQRDWETEFARRVLATPPPPMLVETRAGRIVARQRRTSDMGGDRFDIWPLGETAMHFYLADVPSVGLVAGWTVMYLERALRSGLRTLGPGHVLGQVNQELIRLAADEPILAALVCGSLDADGRLSLARAGMPLPVVLPRGGPAEFAAAAGSLLGLPGGDYACVERQLRRGDKVILTSDGLPGVWDEGGRPARLASLAEELRQLPGPELLDRLEIELTREAPPTDDWTLVLIEAA
ncbi:MAG: SpoIIE family protein phosphatase, partial [Gemmataceae bacterium]|nr:SpoIIE family protein phosphatase [Gemmataceae bacterium]